MLYLIRHPRPDIAQGLCYGQMDVPVSDTENTHALASLIPQLCELKDASIISSPLQRCRTLAEKLAHQLDKPAPVLDSRLQEIHFGNWEGQAWDNIPYQEIDAWANDVLDYTPPAGEPVSRLMARVRHWLTETHRDERKFIVVTHAGVIRALIGLTRQLAAHKWTALSIDYASLTILDVTGKIPHHAE